MNCAGCGKNIGNCRIPITEAWQEFCGECNYRYYEHEEELDNIRAQEQQAVWDELVAKYGYETACEIVADQGY